MEFIYPRFMIVEPKLGEDELVIFDRKDQREISRYKFEYQKHAEIATAELNKLEALR